MDVNVDEEYYNLDGYDYISKTYDLSNNIFSSEEKNVTVSGEGLVKWKFSENYTVKPDKTEK